MFGQSYPVLGARLDKSGAKSATFLASLLRFMSSGLVFCPGNSLTKSFSRDGWVCIGDDRAVEHVGGVYFGME